MSAHERESALTILRTLLDCSRDAGRALDSVADRLDPLVRAELEAEHREFEDDLRLVEWLQESAPGSADAAALGASLAVRIRHHIAREARLYGVLRGAAVRG